MSEMMKGFVFGWLFGVFGTCVLFKLMAIWECWDVYRRRKPKREARRG